VNELWTTLEAEHDEIWRLLDQLTGGNADPPDAKQQRRIAKRLVAYQSAHELSEEAVLWPVVRTRCRDGDELVSELLHQEREVKLALHDLDHLSGGSEEFVDCTHTVAALERTHLSYEQNQVWPRLSDALSPAELGELTQRWTAMRRRAATKPHPHLPPRPAVLRAAMPMLAALDRVLRPGTAARTPNLATPRRESRRTTRSVGS
jgi:Hemerythrin HHE cation binding domain